MQKFRHLVQKTNAQSDDPVSELFQAVRDVPVNQWVRRETFDFTSLVDRSSLNVDTLPWDSEADPTAGGDMATQAGSLDTASEDSAADLAREAPFAQHYETPNGTVKACGCTCPCEHDHGGTRLDPEAEQMLLAAEGAVPGVSADALERMMLDLINAERAKVGVAPLKLERQLNAAAEDHSEWMVANRTISHRGEGGSSPQDRIREAGFDLSGSYATAENIAMQSLRGAAGPADDVTDLHNRLMTSSGHRATILSDDYEYIGIGIEAGNGLVFATQNFARTSGTVVPDTTTGPTPTPEPPAGNTRAFLIDAATDKIIAEIKDGKTINIGNADPKNLSIQIKTDVDGVESVRMQVDGRGRIDNFNPYSIYGDRHTDDGGRDFIGGAIGVGQKTLTYAAYAADRGQGKLLAEDALSFTIVKSNPAPKPPTDLFDIFLVNAANDRIIGEIDSGTVIDIGDADPDNLSILIRTDDARVESMRIALDGRGTVDSVAPYVRFGDVAAPGGGRDILGGAVGLGTKKFWVAGFDEDGAAGTRLGFENFEFTVRKSAQPEPTPPGPDPFEDGLLTRYISGGDAATSYNIEVVFNGGGWTEGIQRAFVRGADFLSDVIIGDAQGRDGVDDILMNVSLYEGGRGGVLASAGPRGTNPDGTTSVGAARFDRIDALWLEDTLLDDVVVHEFFHALGLGTRGHSWEFSTYTYNREFPELSGGNATSVPFGGGHLSESVFDNELNTPTIDAQNYLSETSVAILEDLGYDTYLDNVFDPNDLFAPAPENPITELAFV